MLELSSFGKWGAVALRSNIQEKIAYGTRSGDSDLSIGDPREHNRDRPPTHSERNLDLCSPGLPHPGCAPGAFPAAVAISESTTGKPSPTPARSRHPPCAARVRPSPAALQGRCPPSPVALGEPRPHARFQERLSDLAAAARSNMRTIHTPHRDNPSCL